MERFSAPDQYMDLVQLLGRTHHAVSRARQKELEPYNISSRQARVLITIHNLGEKATLKWISKHVFREIHSVSSQLTRMEQKGLVKKNRDVPGKTLIRFEITEKGLKAYDFAIKRESTHAIFSVLTEEEQQQLRLCLNKILGKALETYPNNT